jgi:hypothetical protein
MNNLCTTWAQGYFVDQPQYSRWTDEEKERANKEEKLLVRPHPTGDAICKCSSPDEAKWVASRLNLAAQLEEMTYDFATGKTDGQEIVNLVRKHIEMV